MRWILFAAMVGMGSAAGLVTGACVALFNGAYKLSMICGFMGAGVGISTVILIGIGYRGDAPAQREEAPEG